MREAGRALREADSRGIDDTVCRNMPLKAVGIVNRRAHLPRKWRAYLGWRIRNEIFLRGAENGEGSEGAILVFLMSRPPRPRKSLWLHLAWRQRRLLIAAIQKALPW